MYLSVVYVDIYCILSSFNVEKAQDYIPCFTAKAGSNLLSESGTIMNQSQLFSDLKPLFFQVI